MRIRSAISTFTASALLLGAIACKSKTEEPPTASEPEKPAEVSAAASAASTAAAAPAPTEPKGIPAPEDVKAPPADASKTASGLASKVLTKGTGKEHPKDDDTVKVHYTGWTSDGKMFDSSVARGEPTSFGVNQVIAGWTEAVGRRAPSRARRA